MQNLGGSDVAANTKKIKKVIKGLNKASKSHAAQAKTLKSAISKKPVRRKTKR